MDPTVFTGTAVLAAISRLMSLYHPQYNYLLLRGEGGGRGIRLLYLVLVSRLFGAFLLVVMPP
ncbi:hypothetical protein EGX47_16510 [Yersinia pseudotuberculosis]|uniref:Uncharacterized protein n=1 Tax=Yersinia pseudotuberculosis TaxID=633 RepID=A0ABN5R8A7_YERPU|nr:hypothetical protein EGX47_16510 [Yersinia pseudotuberculosis]AYW96964.1 hypothetical protein EGX39_14850 [Yersinia pseudotuberculosis]MBO1561113.1 hypothetical protein [Yersinia pseudotuberculosis]RYC27370.1 hypothetical protein EU971_05120 [Yersinia pseudotuberculosis]